MTKIQELAINIMLYSTCGEDEDTLANSKIEQIAENDFHITYNNNPYDPYSAMDFKIHVEIKEDGPCSHNLFAYNVYDSVYGDDGEFTIELK